MIDHSNKAKNVLGQSAVDSISKGTPTEVWESPFFLYDLKITASLSSVIQNESIVDFIY